MNLNSHSKLSQKSSRNSVQNSSEMSEFRELQCQAREAWRNYQQAPKDGIELKRADRIDNRLCRSIDKGLKRRDRPVTELAELAAAALSKTARELQHDLRSRDIGERAVAALLLALLRPGRQSGEAAIGNGP